jgi:hypothetical protein|nr:MAG TPA: protein of unknown function (DUF948) [Caudoviricetes sp.]
MNEKEFIKRIGICVLLVLLCAFAVYFIIGTRKDVHYNGHGVNKVRAELRNAETTQREETRAIDETEKAITRSQKGIDESTRTNREIADTERKDAEIITDCQQILARVRGRTTTED